MAEFARARGLRVEVATFETWRPAGRAFDTVTAAQAWRWVDQAAGSVKAAQVLWPWRAAGDLRALVEVAEPFAAAYRLVAPDYPSKPNRRGGR